MYRCLHIFKQLNEKSFAEPVSLLYLFRFSTFIGTFEPRLKQKLDMDSKSVCISKSRHSQLGKGTHLPFAD